MHGKENSASVSNDFRATGSSGQLDENELKKTLYESMKNSGVLGSLKSQLRSKLYDQLRLKNEKGPGLGTAETRNRISYKIAVSLCADLMSKCDMPYAMSVFLPEAGQQEVLSKRELVDVLAL